MEGGNGRLCSFFFLVFSPHGEEAQQRRRGSKARRLRRASPASSPALSPAPPYCAFPRPFCPPCPFLSFSLPFPVWFWFLCRVFHPAPVFLISTWLVSKKSCRVSLEGSAQGEPVTWPRAGGEEFRPCFPPDFFPPSSIPLFTQRFMDMPFLVGCSHLTTFVCEWLCLCCLSEDGSGAGRVGFAWRGIDALLSSSSSVTISLSCGMCPTPRYGYGVNIDCEGIRSALPFPF